MTDHSPPRGPDPALEPISAEISREKSVRKGHISALHLWWARRPNVLARIAAYLAITEEQYPSAEFLAALGTITPSSSVLADARSRVRDAAWRWCVRELPLPDAESFSVDSMSPSPSKVLDPFAGGGSIPMEASRLGCDAYAGDLNPLAYRILRATLTYPAKLILGDSASLAAGVGGWRGLTEELGRWAKEVDRRACARLVSLFPSQPPATAALDRYFWFAFVRCLSPNCGVSYPVQPSLTLARHPAPVSLSFVWMEDGPAATIVSGEQRARPRGVSVCPLCGSERQMNSHLPESLSWRLCLVRRESTKTFVELELKGESALAPWADEQDARLWAFLQRPECNGLGGQIPRTFAHLKKRGVASFKDLFSPRQFLVAAEYVDAINAVADEMRSTGLGEEKREALSTYLSLFVGHLVNRNSRLCHWNAERAEAEASFTRGTPVMPWVFVESTPRGVMDEWLASVIPAIEAASSVAPAAKVYQASAADLPFADDFFDAVVTDPPYYDAVPYSDLADFFWVWESMISCDAALPTHQRPGSRADEGLDGRATGYTQDAYRRGMLLAFKEIWRVLKPGRKFCLISSGKVTGRSQDYLDLCEQAGLELVDVKRIPEQAMVADFPKFITYLIYLRKPSGESVRKRLRAAQASSLLDAIALGKRVLYSGLAELMARKLAASDLAQIVPAGAKGAVVEQLMEVLADRDPREVLVNCFGVRGLREIAEELSRGSQDEPSTSPIELVLTHFGFSLPSLARPDGAPQVRQKIRIMSAKIAQARDKGEMRGPFLEACTAIERLLRLSVWGWARLVFGSGRDARLMSILKEERADKRYDLNKLAMGDILVLFRRLPDAMAASPEAHLLERKLGRPHVYSSKKLKFVETLETLIALRNKVEHDKAAYWTTIDAGSARSDLTRVLTDVGRLLVELVEAKAIPVIVEPIKEIRDKWNRRTYLLAADDGTELEAHFSWALALGRCYLYFGTEVNPRPVDPLLIPLDAIGEIP